MKRIVGVVAMAALAVVLTLVAVVVLVRASMRIALLGNPALRVLAVIAELVLGIALLLGTTYLATRIALRIFGGRPARSLDEGPQP